MKKILFVVILLAGVVMAGPFVSGQKAEVALDQWVEFMNEAGTYEASWDYYNKGWLKTDAVLLVKLKKPLDLPMGEGFSQDWVLPLHITMNHGPILLSDNFRQGWFSGKVLLNSQHESWIKEHLEVEGEGAFYTSNLYMDLKGNLHINDYSLPFYVRDNGEVIYVEGYSGQGELTLNKKIDYSGTLPTVRLSNDKGEVDIQGLKFKILSDLGKKYGQYLAPGEASFSLHSVKAKAGSAEMFTLEGAHVDTLIKFNESGTDADFTFQLAFQQLQTADDLVTDAEFTLNLERFSLVFLDKYLSLIQEFGSVGAESSTMMAMKMSGSASTDLLPAAPKITVSALKFSTEDGHLSFTGDVAVSADAAAKVANPFEIISEITINAAVDVDKALAHQLTKKSVLQEMNNKMLMSGEALSSDEVSQMAEQQTAMQLSLLVIQGMLIEKDEKYSSRFTFKDGAALLNDKPMPLPF